MKPRRTKSDLAPAPEGLTASSAGVATVRTVITVLAVVAMLEGRVSQASVVCRFSIPEARLNPRGEFERMDPRDAVTLASQIARAARVLFQTSSMHVMLETEFAHASDIQPVCWTGCINRFPACSSVLDRLSLNHVDLPPPALF